MAFGQIATVDFNNMLMPEQDPQDARQDAVEWAPNLTIVKGQAVGQITASKKMAAYASGNSDGTQICKGLAVYSFFTDANGKVYYNTNATPSMDNSANDTSPIWLRGKFAPSKLTGFDATAQGHLNTRVLPNGLYYIP